MTKLKAAYLTFGIPNTSKKYSWEGNNILRITVVIYLINGKFYSATSEHRNSHIRPGQIIHIGLRFPDESIEEIQQHNIFEFYVYLEAFDGYQTLSIETMNDTFIVDGMRIILDKDTISYNSTSKKQLFEHRIEYKEEIVLVFEDNTVVTSGSNDPKGYLIIDGGPSEVRFRRPPEPNYFPLQPTLKEPVG
ncbi:hypothetical protein [Solitalea lacus]|uniref:hypothetical protein n=1 Tax=Solitalea lacus TaxID=2911172 RepID=UPI001EDC505C|nr:hypothetical protein [Solitalea lacus]UKJ06374.1 hypothetical protein L2B55_12605 [Solitalea lacus]